VVEARLGVVEGGVGGWLAQSSSGAGFGDVAIVHPGDFKTLTVTFPSGVTAYTELISRPGLYAIAVIDRNTSRFTGVKFLNRP
jgi:hypothetical protein